MRLFPWGEGEATARVSAPSKDTLILDLAFPNGDAETLVLRKMDSVGKPVTKSVQKAIVSSTWRDTYTPDGHATHDFFEDGTLILRLHQTAAPHDENYVWEYVTAGSHEFVGEDRVNISIFGEHAAAQMFLPTRDTLVINPEDSLPYTVLRRLEGGAAAPQRRSEQGHCGNLALGLWPGRLPADGVPCGRHDHQNAGVWPRRGGRR